MPDYSREAAHGGRVAGVDEVGRGPLAGPVIAACVSFAVPPPAELAALIDDSKRLTPEQRAVACAALHACPGIGIGIAGASVAEIERLNILQASLLAMRRAVRRLPVSPDLVLVDGNRAPPLGCDTLCLIGGDGLSLSVAAASIVAKVTRDRLMGRLAARLPWYGWERNAGYATAFHRVALVARGASRHHRAGFGLVRQLALGLDPVAAEPPGLAMPAC